MQVEVLLLLVVLMVLVVAEWSSRLRRRAQLRKRRPWEPLSAAGVATPCEPPLELALV